MTNPILEIRITLKGRLIRQARFSGDVVSIGRDPESDVFLDNPGISRSHARIERVSGRLLLRDLESANGTFLNDQSDAVKTTEIRHGDQVRVGKYRLEIGLAEDRRGGEERGGRPAVAAHEGTMVLDAKQIERLLERTREAEHVAAPAAGAFPREALRAEVPPTEVRGNVILAPHPLPVAEPAPRPATRPVWMAQLPGFAAGFLAGAGLAALATRLLLG